MTRISHRNRLLLHALLLAAATGAALHATGHAADPLAIRCAATIHTVAGLAFAAAAVRHAAVRRTRYRKLFADGTRKRALLVCTLTALFLFAAVTGIATIFADGLRIPAGLWHAKAEILLCAGCAAHAYERLRRTSRK